MFSVKDQGRELGNIAIVHLCVFDNKVSLQNTLQLLA